ncbi:MAG: PepSY domain-containing protein [Microscillaceae bacterium]|nr:PepSY domain-containing protein [Microscillaceae bacterium]MDW8461799.1 PepSY domain-containing protein [Cytophagales bacterium]
MISKVKIQRYVRKVHRYLGVFLGIQLLAWTIGGLYFSWTNIEQIRGENLRAEKKKLPIVSQSASLGNLLDSLQKSIPKIAFKHIQVVEILNKAYYQIHAEVPEKKIFLFDMKTLLLKKPLTKEEACAVAQSNLKNPSKILKIEYLTQTHGHHEYREKPLPAYAITFGKPNNTTVYVATELGTVQSYRNNAWRIFDFLWMLHTMDYENRDNINNWLLRVFSLIGLITILSGFVLYFLTSKSVFVR